MDAATIMWIVLLIAFIITEAVTAQLVTIWFAAGALAALISKFLNADMWLQWLIFVIVSAVTLIATRPFVKKINKKPHQPTNADRYIGKTALVTEDIDNINATGQVKIEGSVWSARSENGALIPAGSEVEVLRIEGVKLIVK